MSSISLAVSAIIHRGGCAHCSAPMTTSDPSTVQPIFSFMLLAFDSSSKCDMLFTTKLPIKGPFKVFWMRFRHQHSFPAVISYEIQERFLGCLICPQTANPLSLMLCHFITVGQQVYYTFPAHPHYVRTFHL